MCCCNRNFCLFTSPRPGAVHSLTLYKDKSYSKSNIHCNNMGSENGSGRLNLEAIDGSHLHWLDFRRNVLEPFRIRTFTSQKIDQLPTPFLARLQVFQSNLNKYDSQRQTWRIDLASGRGLGPTSVFPPNLLPPVLGTSNILRCMFPRMSREGLPLRAPSEKHFLYELPTAKPTHICGFNMEMFEKMEQSQLGGGLTVTGTVVDFSKAEVLPGKTVCCPFLAFEKFEAISESQIEMARNACAVTGAQCLRVQQQLFHRAFGLQQVSQPPITFTCALNNERAVINCHFVDEDGNYAMAALCKFDLSTDDHFNNFQAWVEAIESWALLYLLPRIKGALGEILRSNPSPPPSPAATSTSHLSIDTNSDNVVTILKALRSLWPTVSWQNDAPGETPINSSIAQCGTPLPTLQSRTLSLPTPASSNPLSSPDTTRHDQPYSSVSQRMSNALPQLRTDLPLSARPRSRQSLHNRRFSQPRSVSATRSDGSTTPYSPCRPPSLSPCTPGPEAPVSSKSPMLVMQKRLELAMSEIQDLRGQVDDLQGQMTGRTETLEKRLECVMERQEQTEVFLSGGGGGRKKRIEGRWVQELEALVEEELLTPILGSPMWENADVCEDCGSPISPSDIVAAIPGHLPNGALADIQLYPLPFSTEELVVRCLALMLRDEKTSLSAIMAGGLMLGCSGVIDSSGWCANVAMLFALNDYAQRMVCNVYARLAILYEAAQTYDLEMAQGNKKSLGAIIEEPEGELYEVRLESPCEEAIVPLVLA